MMWFPTNGQIILILSQSMYLNNVDVFFSI